ncbi:MAG: hypothetical protein M1839_001442 [Geoglossum umbratile]|nr:MAG: hypothetical protein M1839_001442 [Geoglossum umbratile]
MAALGSAVAVVRGCWRWVSNKWRGEALHEETKANAPETEVTGDAEERVMFSHVEIVRRSSVDLAMYITFDETPHTTKPSPRDPTSGGGVEKRGRSEGRGSGNAAKGGARDVVDKGAMDREESEEEYLPTFEELLWEWRRMTVERELERQRERERERQTQGVAVVGVLKRR